MVLDKGYAGSLEEDAEVPEKAQEAERIRVVEATKIYKTGSGSVAALERFSMSVRDAEFVCVLGPSGCGKTTLLWAMSGLHPLTSGQILVDGETIDGPLPDTIGMLFQQPNLLPWRNLRQNIEFPFEIKRSKPDPARIEHLIERTGLTGFEKASPAQLSGGMQQRVSLVRALAQDPSVLLMDEPFGALDALTRDKMSILLLELWSESQKTVVFITHDVSEAILLADRVVVMTPRPGRIERIFDIDLPRPRTLEMVQEARFAELTEEITATVKGGERRAL